MVAADGAARKAPGEMDGNAVHGKHTRIEARGEGARARFFIRIGQAGRASAPRDPYTLPLFPLLLTLQLDLDVESRRMTESVA